MTFQDFLQFKTAQAIVEHIETLSEAEACELIEQLDQHTLELVQEVVRSRSRTAGRGFQELNPMGNPINPPSDPESDEPAQQLAQLRSDRRFRRGSKRPIHDNPRGC